jgi:hypothetical protein
MIVGLLQREMLHGYETLVDSIRTHLPKVLKKIPRTLME